jgi:hypothetical protein
LWSASLLNQDGKSMLFWDLNVNRYNFNQNPKINLQKQKSPANTEPFI